MCRQFLIVVDGLITYVIINPDIHIGVDTVVHEVATEALGNIRTVRAFVKEEDVCTMYNGWMDASYVARRDWAMSSAIFQSSTHFFAGMAMCLMIWYALELRSVYCCCLIWSVMFT